MGKQRRRLIESTAEMFRLPGDLVAGLPRVEVIGCRQVLVENHHGIVEYSSARIDVNGGGAIVSVTGRQLEIRAMNKHELMICGQVDKVEFFT